MRGRARPRDGGGGGGEGNCCGPGGGGRAGWCRTAVSGRGRGRGWRGCGCGRGRGAIGGSEIATGGRQGPRAGAAARAALPRRRRTGALGKKTARVRSIWGRRARRRDMSAEVRGGAGCHASRVTRHPSAVLTGRPLARPARSGASARPSCPTGSWLLAGSTAQVSRCRPWLKQPLC